MSAAVKGTSKSIEWVVERTSTEEGRNKLRNGFKINECALKVFIHDAAKAKKDWSDDERNTFQREFTMIPGFVADQNKTIKIVCMTVSQETLDWAYRIRDIFYHNSEFSFCLIDTTRIPGHRTIQVIDFEMSRAFNTL